MIGVGPKNCICDVPGIQVGQAEDHDLITGVSVVVPDQPCVAAVDHRGGGIGARDTALLGPGSTITKVHAICLSGGSAYGLDAAGGVMHALRAKGHGFQIGEALVPLVPSAIIFDLMIGDRRDWAHPPWWDLGRQAAEALGTEVSLGNAGAGLGATAGPLKGGVGTASFAGPDYTIGALAIANPVGGTVIRGTSTFHAWMLEQNREFGGQTPPTQQPEIFVADGAGGYPLGNTTLAVVATDAALTKDQAQRIAVMAQDGLAKAIRPVHGPLDGDTVFVLSTASAKAPDAWTGINTLGTLASDAVARAVTRGVYEATSLGGYPSYRDYHGP
ncbi:MAG: P1 family peptidase [Pseudomonadota bacterium]